LVVFAKRRLNIYKVAIVGCDFGGLNNLSRMLCSHRVLNNYKQTWKNLRREIGAARKYWYIGEEKFRVADSI